MSDSVKHRTFMGFDLQVHNITIIPGIGPAYAATLATHGYTQVRMYDFMLINQFLTG